MPEFKIYIEAKAAAQAAADADGFDRGLELMQLYKRRSEHDYYRVFMLPEKRNRYGFELRCEVVMCSDLNRCRQGRGPI